MAERRSLADRFSFAAQRTARLAGHPVAFAAAVAMVLLWALSGPLLGFNNTWQLTINTTTTIVTFLIVFLIQNTQNRDSTAMHVKLDELLHAIHGTKEELLDAEEESERELDQQRRAYQELGERARRANGAARSSSKPGARTKKQT